MSRCITIAETRAPAFAGRPWSEWARKHEHCDPSLCEIKRACVSIEQTGHAIARDEHGHFVKKGKP